MDTVTATPRTSTDTTDMDTTTLTDTAMGIVRSMAVAGTIRTAITAAIADRLVASSRRT